MHGRKKFAAKTAGQNDNTKGSKGTVPDAILKQARKSGQLNLSNREIKTIPDKIWKINQEIPEEERNASLDSDEKWWDQTQLNKLILASNQITSISPDVQLLQALVVLDVSLLI
jgi:Leucine-rich repeat (LRR) protein